jgi:hypothetical protein
MADQARAAIHGLDGKDVDGQALEVCAATALNARPWSAASRSRG